MSTVHGSATDETAERGALGATKSVAAGEERVSVKAALLAATTLLAIGLIRALPSQGAGPSRVLAPMESKTYYAVGDSYVSDRSRSRNFGDETYLEVGKIGTEDNRLTRSLVKFDLSDIPPGSQVSSAVLRMEAWDGYCPTPTPRPTNTKTATPPPAGTTDLAGAYSTPSPSEIRHGLDSNSVRDSDAAESFNQRAAPQRIKASKITQDWEELEVNWNNQPGYGGPVAYDNVRVPDQARWIVGSAVQDWVNGDPNYGFMITANDERGPCWASFTSRESRSDPQLDVEWEVIETATPSATTTATPSPTPQFAPFRIPGPCPEGDVAQLNPTIGGDFSLAIPIGPANIAVGDVVTWTYAIAPFEGPGATFTSVGILAPAIDMQFSFPAGTVSIAGLGGASTLPYVTNCWNVVEVVLNLDPTNPELVARVNGQTAFWPATPLGPSPPPLNFMGIDGFGADAPAFLDSVRIVHQSGNNTTVVFEYDGTGGVGNVGPGTITQGPPPPGMCTSSLCPIGSPGGPGSDACPSGVSARLVPDLSGAFAWGFQVQSRFADTDSLAFTLSMIPFDTDRTWIGLQTGGGPAIQLFFQNGRVQGLLPYKPGEWNNVELIVDFGAWPTGCTPLDRCGMWELLVNCKSTGRLPFDAWPYPAQLGDVKQLGGGWINSIIIQNDPVSGNQTVPAWIDSMALWRYDAVGGSTLDFAESFDSVPPGQIRGAILVDNTIPPSCPKNNCPDGPPRGPGGPGGGGKRGQRPTPEPDLCDLRTPVAHEVRIEDFRFEPGTRVVTERDTVRWTNYGSVPHTTKDDTGQLWDSQFLMPPAGGQPGDSFEYNFNAPGVYDYHCQVHPNMKGVVEVLECDAPTPTPTDTPVHTPTATTVPPPTPPIPQREPRRYSRIFLPFNLNRSLLP